MSNSIPLYAPPLRHQFGIGDVVRHVGRTLRYLVVDVGPNRVTIAHGPSDYDVPPESLRLVSKAPR